MEQTYLNLLKDILDNGTIRSDRTNTGTKSVFGRQLHFNIKEKIPLLTTKYINWKHVIEELLWFLRGETDSKILEEKGINIWKGNTKETNGDIGPMYGFIWRHYGAKYISSLH